MGTVIVIGGDAAEFVALRRAYMFCPADQEPDIAMAMMDLARRTASAVIRERVRAFLLRWENVDFRIQAGEG